MDNVKDHYQQVVEFNEQIIGYKRSPLDFPNKKEILFLQDCINEEILEYKTAYVENDLIDGIDALIDLVYFAYGGLHKMGVTPEVFHQCFDAVHEANMTKKKGVKSTRGHENDAIKPEGWLSPEERIKQILEKYNVDRT